MKRNGKVAILISVMILAAIAVVVMLNRPEPVRAQEIPPPTNDRHSFGSVGITSGQTLRVTVANTIMPNDGNLPPGPIRVTLSFRLPNGNLARDSRTGDAIRRVVDIERGDVAFLDLDYDRLPPGPVRAQLRPVVVVQVPPPVPDTNAIPYDSAVTSVEVINNANGRTQFVAFTSPAAIRGFNPQPDPPSPSE